MTDGRKPCQHCPWRVANHGKATPWGFYKKANLRRLWNGIRNGGAQSCHPTDPSHPDHVAAGAKAGSKPLECPGAVILVLRECEKMASYGAGGNTIDPAAADTYRRRHKDGLTRDGILYWVVSRQQFGGVPFIGGPKLPEVNTSEEGIGRVQV